MSNDSDGSLSFGVGFIFGVGLGAILGLLIAPKSGAELRTELKSMANDLPDNLNTGLDDTKDKCCSYVDNVRYNVEKQFKQINDSIKAGKMAAAKKKEELEEGFAEI